MQVEVALALLQNVAYSSDGVCLSLTLTLGSPPPKPRPEPEPQP